MSISNGGEAGHLRLENAAGEPHQRNQEPSACRGGHLYRSDEPALSPPVYGFTLESDTHSRRALRIRPQTDGRHRSRARPDAARPWAWAWAHRWGGPPAVAVMGGFAAGLPLLLVVLPALMRRICRRTEMLALIPLCPLHAFSVPSPAITRQPFYGRKRIKKLTEYERHPRKKQ